jgi:hypothetical protein
MLHHEKTLINLVGHYELHIKHLGYRDEDRDLHIISVDPSCGEAFVDFNACPEWLKIKQEDEGKVLLDNKYLIDPVEMTYEPIN